MRITISLDDQLHSTAKQEAQKCGMTLSKLIESFVQLGLEEKLTSAAKPFELITVSGQFVDSMHDFDRTSAFVVEDDEEEYG